MSLATRVLLLSVWLCQPLQAEDWPHWRGPDRNDHSSESSGWADGKWPTKSLWTAELGEGSASPIIAENTVFSLGWAKNSDTVWALDEVTGKVRWKQTYACGRFGRHAAGDQGLYSGPSSTPEFDTATGLLYTLSTDGHLNCWNTRELGKQVWSLNLYDKYKVPRRPKVGRSGQRDYGYTSSPMVFNDWLIVEVGSPNAGCLIGFDKQTGEVAWRSKNSQFAGHNGGPVPITVEGVPCVAVHNFEGLLVTRLDAGKLGDTVAEYPWKTEWANNIATLAVHENNVVMTSSYNQHKIARLEITLKGGAKEVWTLDEASKVCSPVIHEGSVYFVWREMFCIDYANGKLRWKGGRFGDPGSLIVTRDNRLISWTDQGDLRLIEGFGRSPKECKVLATVPRLGKADAWPHVALSDGRLFLRDRGGHLVCVAISQ